MSDTTHLIHDIVDASLEGAAFYQEAAGSVDDKRLSSVFSEIAKAKADLADNLSAELRAKPKRHHPDGELEHLSDTYGDSRGVMAKANDHSLSALEQSERLVQKSLQRVVMDRDNSFVLRVLAKTYAKKAEDFSARLRQRMRELAVKN